MTVETMGREGSTSGRSLWWIAGFAILAVIIALLAVIAFAVVVQSRPDPEFPSLALAPDPSLSGTVAYFDDESQCVRVVAAAGQPNRRVYCVPAQQSASAEKEGKDIGIDMEWLPDDRLQLTMYRMTAQPPDPAFTPAWRRVVDVRSGAVEEVPRADFAGAQPRSDCVSTSPSGERIVTESSEGHATITLVNGDTERTLLDVRGNPETYAIADACWAPGFGWIAAHDSRLLVIVPSDPPTTRVLTPPMTTFYGWDALSWYAITGEDLLTPAPA